MLSVLEEWCAGSGGGLKCARIACAYFSNNCQSAMLQSTNIPGDNRCAESKIIGLNYSKYTGQYSGFFLVYNTLTLPFGLSQSLSK